MLELNKVAKLGFETHGNAAMSSEFLFPFVRSESYQSDDVRGVTPDDIHLQRNVTG